MPLTIPDMENAKLDVDHWAELASVTTEAPTSTDRLGNVKPTWTGKMAEIDATLEERMADLTAAKDAAVTAAADAEGAAEAAAAAAGTKVAFTTVALGLAATPNGQLFTVSQSNGEGVDVYLNSSSTAVWQGPSAVGDLAMAEVVERVQPAVYAPVASMLSWQTAINNGRGALNSARPKSRVYRRNQYAYVHCPRSQTDNAAVTTGYGTGPTGVANTSSRFLQTTLAQLFTLWTSAYRPPAGTHTVDFWLKSPVSFNARSGNTTQGWTNRAVVAGVWTNFQHQFTTNGSTDWASFAFSGDGVSLADMEIGGVRIYPTVASEVPALASDPQGDDFMPVLAWPKTRHTGRLLDNTGATAEGAGVLRVQGYPLAKAFTEITLIAAASVSTAAANAQLITTDYDTALGTTNTTLAITMAQADGAPDFSGISSFFDYRMTGQGVVILALTVKNGERRAYVNGIEIGMSTAAFAGFSARMFRIGANSGSEVGYASTFRWNGLIGAGKVLDRFVNSDEIVVETMKMQAGLRAAGIELAQMPGFEIGIGDSQTASISGARGPSWLYLQAAAGTYTPNMPVRSLALAGTTTQDAIAAQLPLALISAKQAIRLGVRPILSIATATNNQNEIIADWNGGVAPFTDPNGWYQKTFKTDLIAAAVAGGCYVTFSTPWPDGTAVADWEPARLAVRDKMLADYAGSTKVFVMDFGGTPGTATPADTLTGNFDADHRHVGTAGHAIDAPVATAANNLALDAP